MYKTIFIPTIQHTGTWFVLEFLRNFIPEIVEVHHALEKEQAINNSVLFTCHFPGIDTKEAKKCLPIDSILTLANFFPTVIPVRDPLAAILTRETRHPECRHFYIVDGFLELALKFKNHPNVKFFPIDLYTNTEDRLKLLNGVVGHCGIDASGSQDLLLQIATDWKKQNPSPHNEFIPLCEAKDMDSIKLLLGSKMAEVRYLKNESEIIYTSFLKELGYIREDLLW